MQRRNADLAGAWYRGDREGLTTEVEIILAKARRFHGQALLEQHGTPAAIVVPHAGLAFSGAIAATAFLLVRDALEHVDAFVIFGACHRERLGAPAIWPDGAWETPLGDIEVDAELARSLIDAGVGKANRSAHAGDNAIELQGPFIRYLFPEAKIVPVAMAFFPDSWGVGERAAAVAAASGKSVVAVASTDLTHYGEAFGVMPAGVGESALAWTRANDKRFLHTLTTLDLDKIVPVAERDGSACGAGAAAAAAGWAKARGCRRGRVLAHANSHEIQPRGEAEHMVGYAALAFETDTPAQG